MADAFLHRRSIFDKHKDSYGFKNPIKQMRVSRSWSNPITRHKREKSLHDWANSFAGKRHYRKLSRHNALHLHEEVESLGIPAVYSGSTLTLADGSVVTGISPGIRGKCNITINAVREGDFIRLIPDWDEQENFFEREVHSKYELDYTNHGTKYDHSIAYLNDLGALAHHEAFHLCEEHMNYDIKDLRDKLCTYLKNEVEKVDLDYDVKKLEDSPYPSLAITSKPDDGHYYLEGYLVELKPSDVRFKYQYYGHPHEEVVIVGDDAQDLDVIAKYLFAQVEPKVAADEGAPFAGLKKSESRFTEIKAAIKAAWSAAEVKWFRLDFQESTERLDVYPITSDNEGVGVNWGVLPERNTIVQYATDFRTGNSEIEREIPYKDLDELEKIFVDEFQAMDETLEIGAENGADIHPLSEAAGESYREDVILQILDQGNNTYSKEDLEGKTVAELEEIYSELINLAATKNEAASRIVADNKFGKIVKARLRDNVLAFLPIDDDGKNDDCTYFFKMDGNDIITKGYHWGRDEIDRSMIADDGYPWTAEPNRPTRDWVHTEKYAKQLVDRVRRCLDLGVATQKGEAYGGARFGKYDIVQALAKALHNDEDDKYSIRYFDSSKVGIEPGYAYAYNKEGEDAWKVLDDGTVEFEFAGKPQGKTKVDSLSELESTILKLFGLQLGSNGEASESLKKTLHESRTKKLERMGDVSFADLGADPTDTPAAQKHLEDELYSFERSICDKYDTDADYIKLRLSIYGKSDQSDKPLYTVRYKAGEEKPWQLYKGSRGALIGSFETVKQLAKDFKKIGEAAEKHEAADEGSYAVYSLDDETGRVSKDGEYPTWRKAYAALADGTVWDEGSSNNFVFHGNRLQQIYKYEKTGRTGKWSGNGYDVIFDREISEDPADYIKAHFTPTRYNACRFNESAETGITSRDVQAAARSAWSASGATDFKLDIVRLGDNVIIYTKDLDGEDNLGISWHINIPDAGGVYTIEQYADWGADRTELERKWNVKDLDELEASLEDEFEALQETIDVGKEN